MYEPTWDKLPELQYDIRYDHSDVVVSMPEASRDTIEGLLTDEPSHQLCSALRYVQERYYPGRRDDLPWDIHKRDLVGDKAEARRNLLSTPWPLAWYWKALLSTLRKWEPACAGDWRVAIRQVRQWVMVLVYELRSGTPELLRPPLFGPSQRFLQNDLYWVLLDKRQQDKVKERWDHAKEQQSDYERLHVLGRHDVVYQIVDIQPQDAPTQASDSVAGQTRRLSITLKCDLDLDPHITEAKGVDPLIREMLTLPGQKEPTREKAIDAPYPLLMIPTLRKDKQESKDIPLLLSSDRMCEALTMLSEIWNDPTAKSILIHAPPGSGKEVLAGSIYDFRQFAGKYVSFALSPDPNLAKSNLHMLYFRDMTQEDRRTEVENMVRGEVKEDATMVDSLSDGLLFKARKGVLFLDEIDKEDEGRTRASLLRLLENNEFAVYGTTLVAKIPKDQLPTYVFAASRGTLADILKLKPVDFWTRISHVVEMQHPLSGASVNEQKQICADYFHMFWNNHVPKFFKESNLLPFSFLEKKDGDGKIESNPFIHDYSVGLFWALMDPNVKRKLAESFASVILSRRRAEQISIRTIRSVVGRVVFSLVDLLLYDKDFNKPLAKIRTRLAKIPADQAKWIEKDWSKILAQIIATDIFEPKDKPLFNVNMPEALQAKSGALYNDINIEITRLEAEMRGIIDHAISTIPHSNDTTCHCS